MSDFPTRRALDELADIYLTGPAEPVRVEAATAQPRAKAPQPSLRLSGETISRPAGIEALLLGHLPGYASPWVSQYAHYAGAAYGGAVLVRVHEQVELELFSDASEPPQGGELTTMMESLAGLAGTWLVLIDNPSSTSAPRRLAELPRWTLLSGADDAAIVAGFRMLKSLLHECGGKTPVNGIGVMFMGCDDEAAVDAVRRLNRAAAGFLEAPIELIGARQRMQPVRRRYIGHYETQPGRDPWTDVGSFLCELNEPGLENDQQDSTPCIAVPGSDVLDDLYHEDAPVFSAVKIEDLQPPPTFQARPPRPMPLPPMMRSMQPVAIDVAEVLPPAAPPAPEAESASPKPHELTGEAHEPASAATSSSRTLSDHAELTAIETRCPRQPAVAFALDAAGGMHLLLRHAAGQSVDASLRQLMQARAWAVEHMELLALACRPARVAAPAEAPPALHLFTADVMPALPLADLGVHVHLLRKLQTSAGDIEVHERLT